MCSWLLANHIFAAKGCVTLTQHLPAHPVNSGRDYCCFVVAACAGQLHCTIGYDAFTCHGEPGLNFADTAPAACQCRKQHTLQLMSPCCHWRSPQQLQQCYGPPAGQLHYGQLQPGSHAAASYQHASTSHAATAGCSTIAGQQHLRQLHLG